MKRGKGRRDEILSIVKEKVKLFVAQGWTGIGIDIF